MFPVLRGQDPNVNVVLLEDMAAVVGVGIAATSMGLATYYNSHLPDVIGSLCIGGLLGAVASFIIYTNTVALVGRLGDRHFNFVQRSIYVSFPGLSPWICKTN